ncbi:MAG: DUF465 domain-containing protein [Alphaproteobacteria bacterium]|nr:DUF465 domain-containing protein [Alphaproteobacteria bacterium]
MSDAETLKEELVALRKEHRDLDDLIARMSEDKPYNQIHISRLKKRKLQVKDRIKWIENEILPDIIA